MGLEPTIFGLAALSIRPRGLMILAGREPRAQVVGDHWHAQLDQQRTLQLEQDETRRI